METPQDTIVSFVEIIVFEAVFPAWLKNTN